MGNQLGNRFGQIDDGEESQTSSDGEESQTSSDPEQDERELGQPTDPGFDPIPNEHEELPEQPHPTLPPDQTPTGGYRYAVIRMDFDDDVSGDEQPGDEDKTYDLDWCVDNTTVKIKEVNEDEAVQVPKDVGNCLKDNWRGEVEDIKAENRQLKTELEESQQKLKDLQLKVEELTALNSALEAKELTASCSDLEAENRQLKTELEESQQKLKDLQLKVEELTASYSALEVEEAAATRIQATFRRFAARRRSAASSSRVASRHFELGEVHINMYTAKAGIQPQVEEVKDVGSLNINPTVTRRSPVFKLTPPATRLLLQTKKQVNMAYGRKDDGDEWHQIQPAHCHTTYIEFSGLEDFSLFFLAYIKKPLAICDGPSHEPDETEQRKHLMLSGRFNDLENVRFMKEIKEGLAGLGVPVFMVDAGSGNRFGNPTIEGLYGAKMLAAICTESYGQFTGCGFETFEELRYAHMKRVKIIPVVRCKTFPPRIHGDKMGTMQNDFIFGLDRVRINATEMTAFEIAVELQRAWRRDND
ncbi:unnamed protein product [Durusdinium trenchii]|uniref:Uncharacterized protein n=1 Tax=Durusdinium trenchii TaxID=1381693 RepID=A0ABP0R2X8_9DINO